MEENISYYENQFIKADSLISESKISEAKEMLEDLLAQCPDFGKAHNHLGWIFHMKLSNHEKALYHYKLAMKFEPKYTASYLNYTYLLVDMGKFAEAKDHIERTLRNVENADNASYYSELGRIFEAEQNFPKSYRYYKKAANYAYGSQFIDNMKTNMYRVKDKMSFFEKLKLVFI